MNRAAAFFDLDRTLISGASLYPLGVQAWREGLASNSDVAKWATSALAFIIFGDKDGDSSDDMRNVLSQIAGASVSSMDALGAAVLPHLTNKVRPEARKLIHLHHEAGRDTWIVSASPQKIVEPLAAVLGMTGAIGTRGEIIDDYYTGELDGPFVYGPGKAEAIEKLASDRNYELALCYSYSDSISDLPMLDVVGHPVAVNPDSELYSVARERGWPIVIFSRKVKKALAFGGVGTGTIVASIVAYALGRHHGRASALAQMALRQLEEGSTPR
ncbi:MAG: HAD family hydrolase [Acidimicrobiia bacterium]